MYSQCTLSRARRAAFTILGLFSWIHLKKEKEKEEVPSDFSYEIAALAENADRLARARRAAFPRACDGVRACALASMRAA